VPCKQLETGLAGWLGRVGFEPRISESDFATDSQPGRQDPKLRGSRFEDGRITFGNFGDQRRGDEPVALGQNISRFIVSTRIF
jgi:hypothetical protein